MKKTENTQATHKGTIAILCDGCNAALKDSDGNTEFSSKLVAYATLGAMGWRSMKTNHHYCKRCVRQDKHKVT